MRGEPCGSNDPCTCQCCTNCGVLSSIPLCPRCQSLQQCVTCYRRLPSSCFNRNSDRCQACTKRNDKPQHRTSIANVVNEVTIPTARSTQSFDAYIRDNDAVISNILDDYRRQYRYLSFCPYTVLAYMFLTKFSTFLI